ncbi:MAG TPA: type II secretion system protein [Solirubrobacterales bacterium]
MRNEEGFTVVEMVVTALIVAMGAAATFGLLSAATKNTQRAKSTQVALDRAQNELEELRGRTYDQLALTEPPSHYSNTLNPGYRVSGGTFAVIREPPSEHQPLVVNGDSLQTGGLVEEGTVNPGPEPFSSGDVTGEIYRYVVWRDDAASPRWQDLKQVIVAVKLDTPDNQSGVRGYVEVQSDFIDPTDSAANDPVPGSEEEISGQQFFLSDTPCAASGQTSRQPITGDHLLHNTLGLCADGPRTGDTSGAPDALLLDSPPDPTPQDPTDPPLHDYSDDFYLEPTPDTDKGVQIRRDDSSGCNYVPTGSQNPQARIHRWVSDPMEADFKMEGNATLEFYSRTLNDELYTGLVCVYLFHREESGSPPTGSDRLLENADDGNTHWVYRPKEETWNGFWPRNTWATLRLAMKFNEAPYTIPAGDRLGVALSVERGETQADAIPIMYDHPLYPTRVEIDTTTPIEGG